MREKCLCQRESIRLHLATPLGGGGEDQGTGNLHMKGWGK